MGLNGSMRLWPYTKSDLVFQLSMHLFTTNPERLQVVSCESVLSYTCVKESRRPPPLLRQVIQVITQSQHFASSVCTYWNTTQTMWPTHFLYAPAGPSSASGSRSRPTNPTQTASPLPGPIRRSVRALQPPAQSASEVGGPGTGGGASAASASAAGGRAGPRGKSLWGSFSCECALSTEGCVIRMIPPCC
jgi:hypothetical protein